MNWRPLPQAPRDGSDFIVKFEIGQVRKEFLAKYVPVDVDEMQLTYTEDCATGRAGEPVELRPDLMTWREL